MPTLTRLNITTCIIIGDARRLEKGKTPVRNMRGLSLELEAVNEEIYDAERIYKVLNRSDKQGLREVDEQLLTDLIDILLVKEVELVKYAAE